jgi:hypothetical protein
MTSLIITDSSAIIVNKNLLTWTQTWNQRTSDRKKPNIKNNNRIRDGNVDTLNSIRDVIGWKVNRDIW